MPNQTDAPVEQVDGYRDLSVVGRGATSWVYRAYQDRVRRWVALKVLQVDGQDGAVRQRFDRERSLLAELGAHPHIVQVLDAGLTAGGRPYVAMDLCDGSVADLVERTGPLGVPESLDLMIKIAGATQAAHDLGVLHRDIKPQNILLSRYGPLLADFGIARASGGLGATKAAMQLSPLYAAPEVFFAASPPSEASDVYSLGASLFAILTGKAPFSGVSDEDVYRYLSRTEDVHPGAIGRHDLPDGLVEVIARSIAADPERRQASASRFALDLHACRDRDPSFGRPASVLPPAEGSGRSTRSGGFDPVGLVFPPPAPAPSPPALPPRPPAGVASGTTYVPGNASAEADASTDGDTTRSRAAADRGTERPAAGADHGRSGPRGAAGHAKAGPAAASDHGWVASPPGADAGRSSGPADGGMTGPVGTTAQGPTGSVLARHGARLGIALLVLGAVAAVVVAGLWVTDGGGPDATSGRPDAAPSSAPSSTTSAAPGSPSSSGAVSPSTTVPDHRGAPAEPFPALATFGFRSPPDAGRYQAIEAGDRATFDAALGAALPDPQTREVVQGGNVVGFVFAYPVPPESGVDGGRWTAVPLRGPGGSVAPVGVTPVRIVQSGKNWVASWWASSGMVAVFGNEATLRSFLTEWDGASGSGG